MYHSTEEQRIAATQWFEKLRDQICQEFEAIEQEYTSSDKPAGKFLIKPWSHEGGGGGTMALMNGRVFEKVGVNVSTVYGNFTPEMQKIIPGADKDSRFWASGISIVAHMCSPLVPAVHMNTRHISTSQSWFGGGSDLTPYFPFEEDKVDFHKSLQQACDKHNADYYPKFKKWCDEYFFLPHRNEPRGIGGIFYDNLNSGNWEQDFEYTKDVGLAFHEIYPRLVRRRMHEAWTPEQRKHQLQRRGRYVEFNLLYDRGTAFGLKTGGNIEAILMSMPPHVEWP